ncbi:MAG: DUF4080 domain-containing protein [Desulfobulbaceae bacterium]|nr:DUF4080 domain-containing protein [Desulfobulbaceae bacterium]
MRIKLVAVNGRYTHSCLALYYVRNELARHLPAGEVELLQFALNDPYYQTLLRIAAGKADALFFSVYIWSAHFIKRLVIDLARLLPETPIVLGGPQAPFMGEGLPPSCTVVAGEVEGLPPGFYRDLAAGGLARSYAAEAGRPFAMPYREEDFSTTLANRQIYYESTRGCPFGCTYCLSAASRGVFSLEPGQVEEELARLVGHGPPVVRFVDRTFNAHPGRALALWQFLLSLPGTTCFHFEIAPELFSEAMFDFLATVPPGRFQFEIGLQSTNPETLAAINRNNDMARIAANIGRLVAMDNIHLHVDLILGLPFETGESFRRSFNDVFALAPHHIQMGLLKVLPATPISRQTEAFGLIACQEPPYEVLASGWLTQPELAELYWLGQCVESFCNNRFFPSLWSYLRRAEPDPYGFFTGLLTVAHHHRFFELARTQELMSRILMEMAVARLDRELFAELLRFDWLRSGHRFLPDHLPGAPLIATRDRLYHLLPLEMAPLYHGRDRNDFFKKGLFLDCSAQLLAEVGLASGKGPGTVCFPPREKEGVLGLQRALLLPDAATLGAGHRRPRH